MQRQGSGEGVQRRGASTSTSGVHAHYGMPGRHGRGADWGVWRLLLSTAGTVVIRGCRGRAKTWWVEGSGAV